MDETTALRLLVHNSTDMLSRHAPDGTYLYASPACKQLLGYEPDELVGRSAYELFHPADIAAIAAGHDEILETPDLQTIEYRIRHRSGRWVWFETTSQTVRDPGTGDVVEIQTASRDVTARKTAEARLHDSEERFRQAMDKSPIGMALVGLDGSWLAVNERLCQIVGRTEEQLRDLTFQDITHPDDLDADLAHVQQLMDGEIDRYEMEKRYFHRAGHVVWIQLNGSIVRRDDGEPAYFIAQVQDITDRKRWEAELRLANDRLAASNVELERFAAVASHDLRSPLVTIRGFLALVLARRGDELSDDVRAWLGQAQANTTRLFETVDSLLDLARVGRRPLRPEPTDLDAVVAQVLDDLAVQLDEADAGVDVAHLGTVEADPTLLRIVFQNLVVNAVKFRDLRRRLAISIRADDLGDAVELHVRDNGRGFAPGDADIMFEPFARTSTGEKVEGWGIGLATVRRIVEQHGGSIHAEPLDPGARFTFTLPRPGHPTTG